MIQSNAVRLASGRIGRSRSARVAVLLMLLSTILLAVTTVGSAFLPRAEAAADSFILKSDEQLGSGQRLVSANGQYVLVMQGDGNLVEYAPGNRPIWASGTNAAGSVVRMQSDGNLVIVAPGNRPVWATGTNGNPGATLELQNDANVVVYAQGHSPRWASASAPSGSALGDRIVSVARAEADNNLRNYETGNNCNFYSSDLNGRKVCQPWCADFARWVWGKAGAKTDGLNAAAASFARYPTYRAGHAASSARVGDAVVFNYNGRTASHVGLVIAVNTATGKITTIEGNTSAGKVKQVGPFVPKSRGVSGFASPIG
jgi:CHAP domain